MIDFLIGIGTGVLGSLLVLMIHHYIVHNKPFPMWHKHNWRVDASGTLHDKENDDITGTWVQKSCSCGKKQAYGVDAYGHKTRYDVAWVEKARH